MILEDNFNETLSDLVEQGVEQMNKEIVEKKQLLELLKKQVEEQKKLLDSAKKQKESTEKENTNGYLDLQKMNNLGQHLKSKDALMSNEGQTMVDLINKVIF